jgi:deoxyribodipyrimidine photo-lyase
VRRGKFCAELIWREFATQQLVLHPSLPDRPRAPQFERMPWRQDAAEFRAWSQGRTGFPMVDAGMRELWQTGWMHNRARMIAASFLVKNLLHDWRAGERWFWDTLVDADLASNALNWQWVAGTSPDAAPWFRIFNPETQAQRFDPQGSYRSRYVPEAATPGYIPPLVDLKHSRQRALDAAAQLRSPP